MTIMNLEDKLYTSTEVAEILGVSLRSVYRYLDEGKLDAEVKTATGRHRFTKQNIIDFLYPNGEKPQDRVVKEVKEPKQEFEQGASEPIRPVTVKPVEKVIVEEAEVKKPVAKTEEVVKEEEPIDWLEKFRAAARKYREEEEQKEVVKEPVKPARAVEREETISTMGTPTQSQVVEEVRESEESNVYYYRSLTGGLKDIAQNIDKSSRKASVDYAFTMNAGLSLHKPIRPFSILHVYVRPEDREFFERMLHLVPSEESNAQLCLLTTGNKSILINKKEMHGLYVVSDVQLKKDLLEKGEEDLAKEFETLLNSL
ncbi:MAG: hypothetical protein ACD_22C00176G0004 [uncultured bacterium]|nr:MAG: hypothetical protein ACD_22C00176G0004 [uncultured bacterium]